jgi:hypothetical protein
MYGIYHTARCGVVRKIQSYKTLENALKSFKAACENPQKYAKYDDIISIRVINNFGESTKLCWFTSDPTYWRNRKL